MNELDDHVICHGITERWSCETETDFCVEEILTKGYTILRSSFDAAMIAKVSQYADLSYEMQCEKLGGEQNLLKINDANIARAPCAEFDEFIEIAMDPKMHKVANALLGKNFILYSQNAIINIPSTNHYQFTWHRDLNYQHWTSSRCLALSALLCIDPFDAVTGGTYVLPATHKVEKFPSDRYVRRNQTCIHAQPGDWILFDSMLYHRTGKNSSHAKRRAINHILVPPFMAQQYDFTNMIGDKLTTSEERVFFGQGRGVASTATEWRQSRIDRP
ncbi:MULTISPECIES: phytanoyl-CoA dioxygenase family protein [unclassified Pseudomonas]|uniref:phytanoyl-CoA dioxygenase family protein n=1 Tax=unclassified Pseudomonas TaxID=196821 RepID=UPI0015A0605B|nr:MULTISPECIES: phytanoyl-CoA dioxygenase family protein [unclassified Pseudomonas]NWC92354.1 phytanoyl-CoA dioxygenase family protein [Pseudomonas sp. IPO3779]NWD19864.1 phytanoyl-CoA dioxygenase family protein [Pseudomonas sp. IPO3778]